MGLVQIYNVHAVGYNWTLISTLFFALAPRPRSCFEGEKGLRRQDLELETVVAKLLR